MKDHNPAVKFIDTTHYKGDDRRRQENLPRVSCLIPVTIDDESPEKKPFYGKCLNISHGGGKLVSHELINQQSLVKITFYLHRGEDFVSCTPITGRVVHVHRKGNNFVANIDFRGAVFYEHGIQELIDLNLKK